MASSNDIQRFAIIGLGRFGSRLATNLTAAGQEVIAIDIDQAVVEQMRDQVTLAVALDATDEQALRAQGIEEVDVAVVGIGDYFQARVLATLVLKQMGVDRVISRAVSATDAHIMKRIGADDVVNPEDESADRWAMHLANPWFLRRVELDEGHSIIDIKTPEDWVGKTLDELQLRRELGLHVVAVKYRTQGAGGSVSLKRSLTMPMPDQPLEEDDVLVIMGSDTNLTRVPRD